MSVLDALDPPSHKFSIIYLMRILDLGTESALIRYPADCKDKCGRIANGPLRVLPARCDG